MLEFYDIIKFIFSLILSMVYILSFIIFAWFSILSLFLIIHVDHLLLKKLSIKYLISIIIIVTNVVIIK